MTRKSVSVLAVNIAIPLLASIVGTSIVLRLSNDDTAHYKNRVVQESNQASAITAYKSINGNTTDSAGNTFEARFIKMFPSLKGKVVIEPTDSEYIWKVSMDGQPLYFPTDLSYAIEGDIKTFQNDESIRKSVLTTISTSQEINKHAETNELRKEPLPPKHVGLIRAQYASGLATVNKDFLPYYKATENRDNENPRYLITFVDSTCPACKRFIQQIPALNSMGIDVYLAPFARNGAHTKTAQLMTTVWCERNNEQRLENIVRMKKGSILQSDCTDELYLKNINASLEFGDGFLNQTTPVSFTNNGVIIIANLNPDGFADAFRFGDDFAEYVAKTFIEKE
ncbi:thioredoxin fold domain-containing protein (plasmid) [Shewanella xiamenensis]|uniref:Thioredoxin fold domain-containing protein n=1 Tax=Shewanella xiamenensis TaxID=332186 RepID=A0ABT6UDP6_9GAMM|nr:thioredoxin fold domain-containing protein [Shewanella xiamenensis]MDI5832595.1 thioredoxin fold domain-containing protein [Shewanella xiamenensis]WHF57787.1 thioredoxin fold domain-containing protein [Shewanella xiamenensis]